MDASSRAGRRKAPRLSPLGPILCLALAALVGGCGIDDYPYLYPASGVSQTSSTLLEFSHNTSNQSDYFKGYDVYYRIYDGDSSNPSPVASSDKDYIQSNWDSVSPDVVFSKLKAKGYVRLIDTASVSGLSHLVKIGVSDLDKSIVTILNLWTGDGSISINQIPSASLTIRRNAYDDTKGEYRSFSDFTKASDCNFDATGSSKPTYTYVAAYVIAYGLNGISDIYSRPTMLTNGAISLASTE